MWKMTQRQELNKPTVREIKEPGSPFREPGSARSWRDSNPRAPEGKRISSAPRYDRFDTTPYLSITIPIIMFLVRQVKVVVFHKNSVYYEYNSSVMHKLKNFSRYVQSGNL